MPEREVFVIRVAVDYDGVLSIPGSGVSAEAVEWLEALCEEGGAWVLSSKAHDPAGAYAIRKALVDHGFDPRVMPVISDRKMRHDVLVDDRAFRFTGQYPDMIELAKAAKPWWQDG